MSDYQSRYKTFIFEDYSYNRAIDTAEFHYSFDGERHFTERVQFTTVSDYDQAILDKALWLAFLVIGTSYYKTFPTRQVVFARHDVSERDAELLNSVYHDGLSQFLFENNLTPDDMAVFSAGNKQDQPMSYSPKGTLLLQSGGKDSLLLSTLLDQNNTTYSTMMVSSTDSYPSVLDDVGVGSPRIIKRIIDHEALKQTAADGGLNGHVPVTYIVLALALIDAVLHGEHTILAAIGNEGSEAHQWVGELAVNHQWSKSWAAEQLLADYVQTTISPDIRVGSPLRSLSELRIAELFVEKSWNKFGHRFSSCNLANYMQGKNNDELRWCGECPKCANSFLLFAPFVEPIELKNIFGGINLFTKPSLLDTFKGLLGVDGVMKPFECIGEIDELRKAYHMALDRGYEPLPFTVPQSNFDKDREYPSQSWASDTIEV
ncbi:hypothetical protein EOL96_08100 [Candidatus Saccharibacteria bacterium]|nr:hypothetical protein [Candidatus Saccharibacteria bacterium]